MTRHIITALGLSLALTGFAALGTRSLAAGPQIAKHGADDPAGEVEGEGPKHPKAQIAKHRPEDDHAVATKPVDPSL